MAKAQKKAKALSDLPALVHQQRRLLAGQLRITREERDVRTEIDALLETAGLEVTTCVIDSLGTFEVRRAIARDGHRFASVTPIK